ncbi:signal peptidase II [Desulfonatronovibrio hydrogenovorans]|uniref:signal peptidase II n=1 Tax=Desulfonatronovibrio hydrogenovorans TaxID=53245 RepID=UPI00048E36BC|nr:signal peptidase II [Desulfonatronovibrio hydrogenovorans]
MSLKHKIVFILAGVILVLDQATKIWVQSAIPLWETRTVIPGFFNLVHVLNKGAAFGFLADLEGNMQTYFFIGVTGLAVVLIFHLLRTVHRRDVYLFTALGLILGGALGNLIDRIRLGMVIDFLDFYMGSHHWPAFNVADMAISVGAILLLVSFYKKKRYASGSD